MIKVSPSKRILFKVNDDIEVECDTFDEFNNIMKWLINETICSINVTYQQVGDLRKQLGIDAPLNPFSMLFEDN